VYLLHEKLVLLCVEPKVMIATNIYPKLVGGEHNQLSSVSFNYMKLTNAEDHPDDDMTGAVNLSMDSNLIVNNIGLDNTKSPTGVMLLHQSKAVQKCLNQFLRN
ncbi:unnamed protein product, partial [Brassica oleracea]